MHTKDILATELHKAGLVDMAMKAKQGYYHDYLSPLDFPCLQLSEDLMSAGTAAALALCDRHINGEFKPSSKEANDWAESLEGKEIFAELIGKK